MAKVTIVLEDIDLDAGTISSKFMIEESKIDDGCATAAHIFAKFIQHGITDPTFLGQMWDFAARLIEDVPGARIANPSQRDGSDNEEAASQAA